MLYPFITIYKLEDGEKVFSHEIESAYINSSVNKIIIKYRDNDESKREEFELNKYEIVIS